MGLVDLGENLLKVIIEFLTGLEDILHRGSEVGAEELFDSLQFLFIVLHDFKDGIVNLGEMLVRTIPKQAYFIDDS